MILVVTDELNLRFILQHQGRFLQSARTTTDALRILRYAPGNLEGVVLDDRLPNSKLVVGYVRTHIPGIVLVSWQVALRSSPFSTVPAENTIWERLPNQDEAARYVWDRSQAIGR